MAANGRGRVVLVFGEAGIGKTALLQQFRDELPRRVTGLWGTSDALFTPRPLGPLLEPAAELGGEPRALVAGGAKPFDVAVALVDSLRAIAPAVLIVEDLHWADEATLDVVRVLARQVGDAGLLLVLSYRSDEDVVPERCGGGERGVHARDVARVTSGQRRSARSRSSCRSSCCS